MSPTGQDISPPADVVRALTRIVAALAGLVLVAIGVWWLIDGGSARWPAYLGLAAVTVLPGGLLITGWHRLHAEAGQRILGRTSWTERDAPHYGWRIEAAIVGVLLSFVAAGAAAGLGFASVDAYQRLEWTTVSARYVEKEPVDPAECGEDCAERHRLIVDDDLDVFVVAPSKSWPPDDRLPGARVTLYFDGIDIGNIRAESPLELATRATLILVVAIVAAAGAWTVVTVAGEGPQRW